MMFRTLASGYGSAAICALAGAALWGGGALWWLSFVWLAGAPFTILCAGTMLLLHLVPLTDGPIGGRANQQVSTRH